jgi:hypothetical protein
VSQNSTGPDSDGVPGLHSATLAAWIRAWRSGLVSYDQVLDEAGQIGSKSDEKVEHLVQTPDGSVQPLADALRALSGLDPADVRVVLPAPGDPRGLPGPGPFSSAALLAGEGVVLGDAGWVPTVAGYGPGGVPDPDRWAGVGWAQHPLATPDGLPPLHRASPDFLSVAEADHDLTLALAEATDAFRELSELRGQLPRQIARGLGSLRADGAGPVLPPGYGPRARRLASRASTVAGILTLADGAGTVPVTVQDASARGAALRPLATAARRALAAVVNCPLER